jgi:hypothetical protein
VNFKLKFVFLILNDFSLVQSCRIFPDAN